MYRTIELNSVYPTSGKLVLLLTDIRNFDVILKNIYSTVHNGGSDHGKVTVSFVTADGTTFQTQDFNLTGTAQDFDMHYLYTTSLPLAAKVEMVFSAVNDNDNNTKIYWDGGIDLYKEKFIISPTPNEMYWRGWVQPDQLSRKFMTDQYFISMTATDGLADLKQTDFPFDYSMTTGQTSIAYLLKKSLEPIGLPLPIKSQLNIKEAHLSTGQTVLGNIYANPLKFISFKSGKVKYENAYEAIEMMLDSFNAKLFQSGGYYHIVQQNEISSKQTTYNWNNLTASTISYTRQFNDINKVLFGSDELSKVRPLKRIEYTFPDLNAGSYVPQYLFNGRFDYNVIGWETYIFPAAIEWDSGSTSMKYTMNWALASGEADSQFRVRGLGMNILPDQGSTVTINWDTLLSNVTFFSGDQIPRLTVELWGFNGEESAGDTLMDSITVDVISGKTKTNFVNLKYKDNDTTVYYCNFYFVQQSPIHLLTAYFDNFQAFKNNDSNLTEHVLYTGELNTTSIDLLEGEVNFGNSDSFYDAGALLYAPSGLTTTWSNYGGSENLTLQSLLIKNRLTLFNKFKNYVRITVKTDSIRFNHILNMKGKLYAITAYSFDLMGNNLQLELVEYLNTSPLTITYTSEKLSGNGSE